MAHQLVNARPSWLPVKMQEPGCWSLVCWVAVECPFDCSSRSTSTRMVMFVIKVQQAVCFRVVQHVLSLLYQNDTNCKYQNTSLTGLHHQDISLSHIT